MDWDTIAHEADQKIQDESHPDRLKYIEGLENVISNLVCNLEAAKEDQRMEDNRD